MDREHRWERVATPYYAVRVDGKAFHTYTRGFSKPFDRRVTCSMDTALLRTCRSDAPVILAYAQSDEASFIFESKGDGWLGARLEKTSSVIASTFGAYFNAHMWRIYGEWDKVAVFDGRVVPLERASDVVSYLDDRYSDALRNSVSSCAAARFPHKQLLGLSHRERLALLREHGRH